MRTLVICAVIALLVAPLAASAEEVLLGVTTSGEYDSNVFNAETNEIDDFAIRVTPHLGLRRTQGRFIYDLHYHPRYEHFIDGTTKDRWDHNAFGSATYSLSPRTSLTASNRFLQTQSLNRAGFITDPGQPDAIPVTDVEQNRGTILRNTASIGIQHTLTARLVGTADLGYTLLRRDQEGSFDSDTLTGTGEALYTLSARDQVGGGMRVTWQSFQDSETQPGSETIFYNFFGSWIHVFDPSMTFSIRAGPTIITSDPSPTTTSAVVPAFPFENAGAGVRLINSSSCPLEDGVPVLADSCDLFGDQLSGIDAMSIRSAQRTVALSNPGSTDDARVTIFATIEFTKSWEKVRTVVSYRRTDSSASGSGQSTILDALTGQLFWNPWNRWQVDLTAQWTNRESSTNQTRQSIGLAAPATLLLPSGAMVPASASTSLRVVSSDQFTNVSTWLGRARVTRLIGERASAFVGFSYLKQSSELETRSRDFDVYRLTFGFTWNFRPIQV